jgi:serine/threonine protein kinase
MSTKSEPISDVFSAGLIFHYLLFGHSVFSGKKYNEILNQNRACDFDFSEQKYQDISPLVLDLLKKMLEKEPLRRVSAKRALQHAFFNQESIRVEIE